MYLSLWHSITFLCFCFNFNEICRENFDCFKLYSPLTRTNTLLRVCNQAKHPTCYLFDSKIIFCGLVVKYISIHIDIPANTLRRNSCSDVMCFGYLYVHWISPLLNIEFYADKLQDQCLKIATAFDILVCSIHGLQSRPPSPKRAERKVRRRPFREAGSGQNNGTR